MISKYPFNQFILTLVLFIASCDGKDDQEAITPVCNQDFFILKALPDNNPKAAPVLLEGIGFSENTKVYFNGIEAEAEYFNSNKLATRVPNVSTIDNEYVELQIVEDECKHSVFFNVTDVYDDINRVSPPYIIFVEDGESIEVDLKDLIESNVNGLKLTNLWGWNQRWEINSYFEFFNPHKIVFSGNELIEDFQGAFNSFEGTYDVDNNRFELKIIYDDDLESGVLPGDFLIGGFYRKTLLSRKGQETMDFLLVTSQLTGRQFVFRL